MKRKKVPLRKCVACSENKPKKELLRIVKSKEGHLDIDLTGKANGRGAYICPTQECLDKSKKNKQLSKALKVNIPDELYDRVRDIIKHE
ncbi:MAG: YlxR family protein [Tissierellia bacterium]|nr:YlxR family protein [Tissierellia bacterium]